MHQQRLFVQPIIRCEERFETCRRNSRKRVIHVSRIFFASRFFVYFVEKLAANVLLRFVRKLTS